MAQPTCTAFSSEFKKGKPTCSYGSYDMIKVDAWKNPKQWELKMVSLFRKALQIFLYFVS